MKTYLIAIALLGCSIGFTSCATEGAVVETRPADVVYVRPASPGPGYVWIGGDWVYRGGSYRWHEGRWARGRARTWSDGHWQQSGNGWRWNRGHWK
jgi:hypothetical protein